MTSEESAWFRTFFDDRYLRACGPALRSDLTERQAGEAVALLGLEPPASILDLACGHGRHAIALARRGFRVTGLDLSAVSLEKARSEARAAGVSVAWIEADMREIPLSPAFDGVINLFTSFGYFEEEADDLRVLREIARVLKPDAPFLVETIHRDALLRDFQAHLYERSEGAGSVVLHDNRFDILRGRIEDDVTVIEAGHVHPSRHTSVRLYTVPEWRRLLSEAGLALEGAYGGLSGRALTLDSWRLALVARRPG